MAVMFWKSLEVKVGYFELYSVREAIRLKEGQEDVYDYETLPKTLRAQIIHVMIDGLGGWNSNYDIGSNKDWSWIYKTYIKEKGVFYLDDPSNNPQLEVSNYFLNCPHKDAIDLLELMFCRLDLNASQHSQGTIYHSAIEETNFRLKKQGIGYEFVDGKIIRIDSKFLHAETVRPAISLLKEAGQAFDGPRQEFFESHRHYREGNQKEAVVWACKSFESTLKSICTIKGWSFDPTRDTAKKLIDIVLEKGIVPIYLSQQFNSLRSILESGVPTARNKSAGHGQGPIPTTLPTHFVAYVLHLTASNIVYLMESCKEYRE